jgi:hypothetical protein
MVQNRILASGRCKPQLVDLSPDGGDSHDQHRQGDDRDQGEREPAIALQLVELPKGREKHPSAFRRDVSMQPRLNVVHFPAVRFNLEHHFKLILGRGHEL